MLVVDIIDSHEGLMANKYDTTTMIEIPAPIRINAAFSAVLNGKDVA